VVGVLRPCTKAAYSAVLAWLRRSDWFAAHDWFAARSCEALTE